MMKIKKCRTVLFLIALLSVGFARAQCSGCSISYNSSSADITVNSGVTVCINSGATMSGNITMNGGVLCNSGTINSLKMHGGRGTVINNGTIKDNETTISILGNYYITANASSQFSFAAVSFNFISGDSLYFNVAASSGKIYFPDNVSFSAKKFSVKNSGEFKIAKSLNINGSQLLIVNNATGTLTIQDALNLTNSGNKVLANSGVVLLQNGVTIGGTGSSSNTVSISSSGQFSVSNNFQCTMSGGNLDVSNSGTTSSAFYVESNLTLREVKNTFTNSGNASIGGITTSSGSVGNSGQIVVTGTIDVAGSYTNSNYTSAGLMNVSSNGTLTNSGLIDISSTFSNNGVMDLSQGADLNTTNYYNMGNGSINGPSSAPSFTQYASLLISGTSQNNSYLTGKIKVYDLSLVSTTANVGFGFDAVSSTTRIANTVNYLATSSGPSNTPSVTIDCSGLGNYYFVRITKEQPSQCPGTNVILTGALFFSPAGLSNTVNAVLVGGTSFTWQPGNLVGSPMQVNPTVTTTYTLNCAMANGCSFTQTITIPVTSITYPTISYATFPYFSNSSTTFSVNQTGPAGGTYSATPSLSINPATGLITPTASAYGTYTVSYYFSNLSGCGPYSATYTLHLDNLACNPVIEPNKVKMCQGDRIVVTAFNGVDGYTMVPSSGLSCTSCTSPTVTAGAATTIYTLTSSRSGTVCGTFFFTVEVKPDCDLEDLTGCCFSNYGASVTLASENTYINVYCNVINELGVNTNTNVSKGQFSNLGTIQALLYWIHNAKNNLYTSSSGTTRFFGADQKIKGNSNTWFNIMHLEGNGTKSIWIDEYCTANLYFYSNVLNIQNNSFFMKNAVATVSRTSGYASTGLNGYFSWLMSSKNANPTEIHLYPLGSSATSSSPFRYRPLLMANNTSTLGDEISANFMNTPPSLATDPTYTNTNTALTNNVNNLSPSVVQVNNAFYHKIKTTYTTASSPSNLNIKSYYFLSDGSFQSLAEWEKDPSQLLDWWGTTPGASASFSPSADPGTPGMVYAQTNGALSFNGKPFTLSKGGFFVNTSQFGNSGGTVMTLSASPSTNSSVPTPSGGGLNATYGTGAASGNSGGGGPTVFAPVPVAGDYVMNVLPDNDCAVPAKLKFTIDQNGNIAPASVLYGLPTTTNYLGELSPDVYTIDNVNSGITFSATPKSILSNCINSITVSTSVGNDFVFDKSIAIPSAEKIDVFVPGNVALSVGNFRIYNTAGTYMNSPGYSLITGGNNALTLASPSSYVTGVYTFKFNVSYMHPLTLQTVSEELQGQFIIK